MRVIASAFVFMALAAGSAVAQSADDEPEPTLTVQGSGEIRVALDLATVRVGITEQASTAEATQRAVNTAANDTLEAVRALGIEDRHIQTARLTRGKSRHIGPRIPSVFGWKTWNASGR